MNEHSRFLAELLLYPLIGSNDPDSLEQMLNRAWEAKRRARIAEEERNEPQPSANDYEKEVSRGTPED